MSRDAPRARLFIAVQPQAAALEHVAAVLAPLRASPDFDGLRWTEPEKLHFTLRFLGSVAAGARSAIAAACSDVAAHAAPFELALSGAGAFPAPRRATVLWIGVGAGATELAGLEARLNPAFDALGFPREQRPFTPHLTVARAKRPRPLTAAVASLAALHAVSDVRELLLVQSHLGGQGSRYEVLERWSLSSS